MNLQKEGPSDAVFIQMRSRSNSPSSNPHPSDVKDTSTSDPIDSQPFNSKRNIKNSDGFSFTDITASPFSSLESRDSSRISGSTYSSPSRWKTPEFWVYYVGVVLAVRKMASIAMELSQPTHQNYPLYKRRLKAGWIMGRQVDNSDAQYRLFRNSIPHLILLCAVYLGSSFIYSRFSLGSNRSNFIFLASIVVLLIFHGLQLPKILLIMWMNYLIGKKLKGHIASPFVIWAFDLLVLFGNEIYDGYPYKNLHSSLEFLDADNLKGILPRWHINFNITMLRLISFNLDYYWACSGKNSPIPIKTEDVEISEGPTDRERTTSHHPVEDYSFKNFATYALYPPLYIAGPIMTFNNFLSQLKQPPRIPTSTLIGYGVRFLFTFLTMEFILHFMYVVAIKDSKVDGIPAWKGDTVAELCMIGFWNLIIVWMKLLIPWRFFRMWALLDGIDPPENMIRCMANNYSTLGFWRSWHRSYNLWLTRYLYIPLGGSKRPFVSMLVVFTFVALWHDLSLTLLTWGWVVSIFVLPEILARNFVSEKKFGKAWWYRHVCALGAVGNILMMMIANLIGFVMGSEGVSYLLSKLVSGWEAVPFLLSTAIALFMASQLMMEYREEEKRRGIFRKC